MRVSGCRRGSLSEQNGELRGVLSDRSTCCLLNRFSPHGCHLAAHPGSHWPAVMALVCMGWQPASAQSACRPSARKIVALGPCTPEGHVARILLTEHDSGAPPPLLCAPVAWPHQPGVQAQAVLSGLRCKEAETQANQLGTRHERQTMQLSAHTGGMERAVRPLHRHELLRRRHLTKHRPIANSHGWLTSHTSSNARWKASG